MVHLLSPRCQQLHVLHTPWCYQTLRCFRLIKVKYDALIFCGFPQDWYLHFWQHWTGAAHSIGYPRYPRCAMYAVYCCACLALCFCVLCWVTATWLGGNNFYSADEGSNVTKKGRSLAFHRAVWHECYLLSRANRLCSGHIPWECFVVYNYQTYFIERVMSALLHCD